MAQRDKWSTPIGLFQSRVIRFPIHIPKPLLSTDLPGEFLPGSNLTGAWPGGD